MYFNHKYAAENKFAAIYLSNMDATVMHLDLNKSGNKGTLNRRIMQHEFFHNLLSHYIGDNFIPAWFNEGMARFFESWNFDSLNKDNIKNSPKNILDSNKSIIEDLKKYGNGNPAITEICRYDKKKFYELKMQRYNYCISGIGLCILAGEENGRAIINEAIMNLRDGKSLDNIFTIDRMKTLDVKISAYLKKSLK